MKIYEQTEHTLTVIETDLINNDIVDTPCKTIKSDRVVLNTTHFSVTTIETDEGVIIDVFHRNGDLIDTRTYWNDDVMEEE